MQRFFFPTTTDGKFHDDDIGTEHEDAAAALDEGRTFAREMARERLHKGEINFEETVEIKDEAGHTLGKRTIRVIGSDD
jgi:hypothetical protein